MLPARPAGAIYFCIAACALASLLRAAQPGDIVRDVNGLAVAPSPSAAKQRTLHGSPALVLAVQGEWTRLLAADGASGWTDRRFTNAVGARIAVTGSLELSDRSPDQPSISEGIDTFHVPAKDAFIAGASIKSRVASLRQLLLPQRWNPFLTPWLEVRSGSRTGWIVPSELPLEWGEPVRRDSLPAAMDRLGLRGVVRRPFIAPVEQLAAHCCEPHGSVLQFETISSKPERVLSADASITTLDTLVRLPQNWAAAFSGSRGYLLAFGNGGAALVRQSTPVIIGAREADFDGDGSPELAVEFASIEGDGYTTVIWVLDAKSRDLRVTSVPLGGSSGEPGGSMVDAVWWIEGRHLWIARAHGNKVEYELYAGGHSTEVGRRAYAVVVAQFQSRDAAERLAIKLADRNNAAVHVFPVRSARGAVLWAAGRLFQRRADAEHWQRDAALPATALQIIAVSPTRLQIADPMPGIK